MILREHKPRFVAGNLLETVLTHLHVFDDVNMRSGPHYVFDFLDQRQLLRNDERIERHESQHRFGNISLVLRLWLARQLFFL